ncbi:MAG: hypothetical protein J0M35_09555 [Candidatus Obscuribacter phosphatis]|uniref:Uncharacterized protein n=1 Tax=Candidatus Obscuribacter phosphatis TaxID=1906157 RepID=A0A8J7PCN4_9BACT|nr:hypothetical protein [Candidatus Obscuribacter phosphatis]
MSQYKLKSDLLTRSAEMFASSGFTTYDKKVLRTCYSMNLQQDVLGVVKLDYHWNRGILCVNYIFGIRFEQVYRLLFKIFPDDEGLFRRHKKDPLSQTIYEGIDKYRNVFIRWFFMYWAIQSEKDVSDYLKEIKGYIPRIILPYFKSHASLNEASNFFKRQNWSSPVPEKVIVYVLNQEYDLAESVVRSDFLNSWDSSSVDRGNRLLEFISEARAGRL